MPETSRHAGAGKRDPRQAGLGSTGGVSQDVYGTRILDEVRLRLKAQMDLLKVAINTYDPTFSYVYDHHRIAYLRLNAVTIDIDEAMIEPSIGKTGSYLVSQVDVIASVRVHLGYANDYLDVVKGTKLVQSIDNWLQGNWDLGDGYHLTSIDSIKLRLSFEESATVGSELICKVRKFQEYTQ